MWTTNDMPLQEGKTVLITGANTGIGYETALAFYLKGARVILACRDIEKANDAAARIKLSNGSGSVVCAELDLASLNSVKAFSEYINKNYAALNVLINNAGVMIPPASKTAEGFELQFGTNFIGHFALTGLLYPLLKATKDSRIVTLSSMAYVRGAIDFNNLFSEVSYDPMREYAQSKLADLMLSIELNNRIIAAGDTVLSIAAQPGANATELARHMDEKEYKTAVERFGGLMEPWQGALPSLFAATNAVIQGGALYGPHIEGYKGYPVQAEILPHALNKDILQQLWAYAENATSIVFP